MQDNAEVELLSKNAKSKKASFDTLSEAVATEVSKKLLDDLTALQENVVRQQQEINKLKKQDGKLEMENSSLKKKLRTYCPSRGESLHRPARPRRVDLVPGALFLAY